MEISVNWIALIVAVVVAMALGFLWYSPLILGKQWMRERGLTNDKLKSEQNEVGKWYAVTAVVTLISAFVLSHVMILSSAFYGYGDVQTGLTTAFFMWLGFVLPVQLTATIFSDKKNFRLLAIDSGYQLVSLLAMGVVIGIL